MDFKNVKVKDYFDIHDYYTKQYGIDNTIILMQVGSFHECYGTDLHGTDIIKIANLLEISHTKKNKNKNLSKSNPRMIGFPVYVIDNWVEKLIKLNFTVIVFDQTTLPPNPKRGLKEIYSPATYFEKNFTYNVQQNNYLTVLYFKIMYDNFNNINLISAITSYDITTGKGTIYENYSNTLDPLESLDEIGNILDSNPSKQFLIYFDNPLKLLYNKMSHQEILNYLLINNEHIIDDLEKIDKKTYQKKLLSKIFDIKNNNQIFDKLDISTMHYAVITLCLILNYIMKQQPLLIRKLQKPIIYSPKNKLYYGNKPIEQLDIISNNKSLFNIIDNTGTSMGKRLLRHEILNPIINTKELKTRYKHIKLIINDCEDIYSILKNISDLSRLLRKIQVNKITPNEFFILYQSLNYIKNLDNDIINNIIELNKNIPELNEIITFITNIFDLDYLSELNFYNYTEESKSLFKKKYNTNIDDYVFKINNNNKYIETLAKKLSDLIIDKRNTNKVIIKTNDRDGTYLLVTNRRYKMIIQQIKNKKINSLKILDTEIEIKDLNFIPISSKPNCNIKIITPKISNLSNQLVSYKSSLAKLTKELFYSVMDQFIDFNLIIIKIINKIEYLDFINSGALTAKKNGYCCPKVIKSRTSYFKAKQLRHPIVENLFTDTEYMPHNIELGGKTKHNGIILYGINGSGKSTLMKSIGINIILAQIGYFVAAKSFTYSPYKSIFTRIRGNDNLFKKMSSFYVEMAELRAILQRNNKNTLVLADEMCRGTEEKSANIIVTYMLELLAKNKCSFITATHLHTLTDLPSIKKLNKVSLNHISIDYDEVNHNLIYSRKLLEGAGTKFYGLQVAKFLINNSIFNDRTFEIEQEYKTYIENINLNQKNRYNSNLQIIKCYICNKQKNLEIHHINWQKNCNKYIVIDKPHIKRNSQANLVCLCRKCHDKVDSNKIIINGWTDSIKGKYLNYSFS